MSDAVNLTRASSGSKYNQLFAIVMIVISCVGFEAVPFFVKGLSEAGVKTEFIPVHHRLVSAVFLSTLFMLNGH